MHCRTNIGPTGAYQICQSDRTFCHSRAHMNDIGQCKPMMGFVCHVVRLHVKISVVLLR